MNAWCGFWGGFSSQREKERWLFGPILDEVKVSEVSMESSNSPTIFYTSFGEKTPVRAVIKERGGGEARSRNDLKK